LNLAYLEKIVTKLAYILINILQLAFPHCALFHSLHEKGKYLMLCVAIMSNRFASEFAKPLLGFLGTISFNQNLIFRLNDVTHSKIQNYGISRKEAENNVEII
jgi:hypothetical protein